MILWKCSRNLVERHRVAIGWMHAEPDVSELEPATFNNLEKATVFTDIVISNCDSTKYELVRNASGKACHSPW